MQIQNMSNSQNFCGIKVQTVTSSKKTLHIYSINSKDRAFIDRMLNVVKGQKFPENRSAVGEETARKVYDSALKTAKKLPEESHDKVFIAIENGKKITGIMSIGGKCDQVIQGLTSWTDEKLTKLALITTALKETSKSIEEGLVVPTKNLSDSIIQYFRKLGFCTTKNYRYRQLAIEDTELLRAVRRLSAKFDINARSNKQTQNVDMAQVLKLDE